MTHTPDEWIAFVDALDQFAANCGDGAFETDYSTAYADLQDKAEAYAKATNPDLLAALKRIFNGFEETGSWPLWATHQSFNGDPAEVSAWEQARAAITKATE